MKSSCVSRRSRTVCRALVSAVGVAGMGLTPTWADDVEWGNVNGGVFSAGANWVGGVAPGDADVARFRKTRNPDKQATYTVTFNSSPTNVGMAVERDNVTLDLNGNAYLLNSDFAVMSIGWVPNGSGRLRLIDGVVATTAPDARVTIGAVPNAPGFLTLSTGAQLLGPSLHVGNLGPGTLLVNNGADLVGGPMYVGSEITTIPGTATVVGAGSTIVVEELFVAGYGVGTLNINAGGRLESTEAQLGQRSGTPGTVNVDGAGSRWTSSDIINIGWLGSGVLNITGGGRVQCDYAFAGVVEASSGAISVSGAGELVAQGVVVGNQGAGTMNVSGGGQVQSPEGRIGVIAPGTVTINGAGSRWTCSTDMFVGAGTGTGTLTITGGAEVGATNAMLAKFSGTGSASVSGPGSKWTVTNNLSVGGDIATGPGGTGSISIGPGGVVTADGVFIFLHGSVELDGGTLDAARIIRPFATLGDFTLLSGVLHADFVEFAFQNQGATLAPGHPGHPAGRTVIIGSYTQTAPATMEIEIGGTQPGTQHDQVVPTTASLGGTLALRLIDGFTPSPSQTFVILNSSGITGSFANVANGARLGVAGGSGGGGSFIVNYGPGSPFDPRQVVLSGFGPCAADFNGDGIVNSTDVSDFINAWFSDLAHGTFVTDFDGNGVVNSTDVSAFINQWFSDQASGCGG